MESEYQRVARGLDADPGRSRRAQNEGATVLVGDLMDERALEQAVAGSDIVPHIALPGSVEFLRRPHTCSIETAREVSPG